MKDQKQSTYKCAFIGLIGMFIILFTLAVSTKLYAQYLDGPDKAYHFVGDGGLAVPSYVIGYEVSKGDRKIGYLFGIGLPTLAGLLKEELDRNTTGLILATFK